MTFKLRIFFIIYFLFFSDSYAFALRLTPSKLNIKTKPGEVFKYNFVIQSTENYTQDISVYPFDFVFSKGKPKFVPPKNKSSISNFVTVQPNKFSLEPNQSKNVEMTLSTPENISGSNQFAMFFETSPQKTPSAVPKKFQMNLKARMISLIFQDTEGAMVDSSKIKNVSFLFDKNGFLNLTIDVSNEGNSSIKAYAFITIMDKDYNFIGKFETTGMKFISPGNQDKIQGSFPTQLKKGTYHAIIEYHFRDKTTVIDKVFDVK